MIDKAMNITFITSCDFIEGNGANSRIRAFARGLQARGHRVELNVMFPSDFNNTGINSRPEGFVEGIRFRYFARTTWWAGNFAGKLIIGLRAFFESLLYLLRSGKRFDISYLYGPTFIYYWHIFLLSKLLGFKIVIEQTEKHSTSVELQKRSGIMKWLKKYSRLIDERYSQYFCDHMFVISTRLFGHYRKYFPKEKLTLLPIVVDPDRFMHLNGEAPKGKIVGYLGSFGHKDGVPGIMEGFSMARESIPELKLRLMGHVNQYFPVEKYINHYNLDGELELTGQLRYREIPQLLRECSLLVVNRVNTPFAHYGFPTKLGEYLAAGRPVVVTDVGDVRRYFTNRKDLLIIDPEKPEQLARVIRERFDQPGEFNEIASRGRKTAYRLFAYPPHVEKMEKIFLGLLNR